MSDRTPLKKFWRVCWEQLRTASLVSSLARDKLQDCDQERHREQDREHYRKQDQELVGHNLFFYCSYSRFIDTTIEDWGNLFHFNSPSMLKWAFVNFSLLRFLVTVVFLCIPANSLANHRSTARMWQVNNPVTFQSEQLPYDGKILFWIQSLQNLQLIIEMTAKCPRSPGQGGRPGQAREESPLARHYTVLITDQGRLFHICQH